VEIALPIEISLNVAFRDVSSITWAICLNKHVEKSGVVTVTIDVSGGKESLHGFDGWLHNTLRLLLDGHTGLLNQLWKTLSEVLGGGVVLESISPLLIFFSNLHDLVLSVVDRNDLAVVVGWLVGFVKIPLGLVVISFVSV